MILRCVNSCTRQKHTWIKPEGFNTGISVYNCVAKEKVPLVVRNKNLVTWYTCGPTVYDSAHIGHASCYVKLDIIQRILCNYFQLNVVTAMNITDIDDKIIKRSREKQVSHSDLAVKYEKEFWQDIDALKVRRPNVALRVTENIQHIIKFSQQLLYDKRVYKENGGSLCFDVNSCNNYGKLQNINVSGFDLSSSSVKSANSNFAVWKSAKEGEPFWKCEWGHGRPGWHTECSAIAGLVFGSEVDIHAGGIDLRFPHHENEEAQACAYFNKTQWVNYWLHTGSLHLKSAEKMSKSLANTISISTMLESHSADVFRMACLMSHYRSNMEYDNEYITAARRHLEIYKHFVANCDSFLKGHLKATINSDILNNSLIQSASDVRKAFSNDFDTAAVIKTIGSLMSVTNKMLNLSATSDSDRLNGMAVVSAVLNFIVSVFDVVGIELKSNIVSSDVKINVNNSIVDILINFRQNVRQSGITNKEQLLLQLCDSVREDLSKCGIVIKDHGKLSSWSK